MVIRPLCYCVITKCSLLRVISCPGHLKLEQKPLTSKLFKILTNINNIYILTMSNTKKRKRLFAHALETINKYWLFLGYSFCWYEYCNVKPKQKPLTAKLFKVLTKLTVSNTKEGKLLSTHALETIYSFWLFRGYLFS